MQDIKYEISLVTSLSDQELDDITLDSTRAFLEGNSPVVNSLVGGQPELIPDLYRTLTRCCVIDGACYIATDVATKKVVGTALWSPPGKILWATAELRRATGFNAFFVKLDEATTDWWLNEHRAQFVRFMKGNYGLENELDSWWLNSVAVLPEYQRHGIASSLLAKVLKEAATNEAIGLCTDAEKNIRFYESLGFEEIGVFYMRHATDGSDIKLWCFKQYGARTSSDA